MPVKLSDIYPPEEPNYYGNLIFPFLTETDKGVIINCAYRSDIYYYEYDSGILHNFDKAKSKYTGNNTPPNELTKGKRNRNLYYEYAALQFREVYHDKINDIFFRVHQEGKNEDEPNTQTYLMLLDKSFNPIAEFKLPTHFKPYYMVHNDKIYFYLKNDTDDIYLGLVDISKILHPTGK